MLKNGEPRGGTAALALKRVCTFAMVSGGQGHPAPLNSECWQTNILSATAPFDKPAVVFRRVDPGSGLVDDPHKDGETGVEHP